MLSGLDRDPLQASSSTGAISSTEVVHSAGTGDHMDQAAASGSSAGSSRPARTLTADASEDTEPLPKRTRTLED